MGRQRNQNIRQNICRHNVISLRSDLRLHLRVVDQVSEDHMEFLRIHAVCAQVVLNGGRRAGIQIRSDCALNAEHQGQNSEDPAARAHIEHHRLRRQVFADLADAELCGLMHAGPECSSGIDVEDQRRLLIGDLRLLPGRDRQDVVDPELVEILFPVVDPVHILGLLDGDSALAHIRVCAQHGHLLKDGAPHLFGRHGLLIHKDFAVLRLLQEETEHRGPVIFSGVGQDIHEHLLLLRGCQRHMVLDLRPVQADILHGAYDNVLRLGFRADSECHPFHKTFLFSAVLAMIDNAPKPAAQILRCRPAIFFTPRFT